MYLVVVLKLKLFFHNISGNKIKLQAQAGDYCKFYLPGHKNWSAVVQSRAFIICHFMSTMS